MIRDPSDGSVREKPVVGEFPTTGKSAPATRGSLPSGESNPSVMLDCAGADTGLPVVDPKEIARLNESREWLKKYIRNRSAKAHDMDPNHLKEIRSRPVPDNGERAIQKLLDACRGVPYLAISIKETIDDAGLKLVEK